MGVPSAVIGSLVAAVATLVVAAGAGAAPNPEWRGCYGVGHQTIRHIEVKNGTCEQARGAAVKFAVTNRHRSYEWTCRSHGPGLIQRVARSENHGPRKIRFELHPTH